MKTCTKCQNQKSIDLFHKDKSRKDGYRNWCKACVSLFMKNKHLDNPDAALKRVNEWIKNPENRLRHNQVCAKWAKKNSAKVNARTARRYASRKKATPSWIKESPEYMWMIEEAYELARLRTKLFDVQWEVDHIVPLRGNKVSGLHVPWNLRVVTHKENRVKSNSYEVQF
jgi:hypothetical protein